MLLFFLSQILIKAKNNLFLLRPLHRILKVWTIKGGLVLLLRCFSWYLPTLHPHQRINTHTYVIYWSTTTQPPHNVYLLSDHILINNILVYFCIPRHKGKHCLGKYSSCLFCPQVAASPLASCGPSVVLPVCTSHCLELC